MLPVITCAPITTPYVGTLCTPGDGKRRPVIIVAKLVAGGYVDEEKTFVDRRPRKRYHLTTRGRDAFVAHVAQMQALLKGSS